MPRPAPAVTPQSTGRPPSRRPAGHDAPALRRYDAFRPKKALWRTIALLFLSLGAPARAQEPTTGGELVGKALDALKLREAPPPPADFVRESRPDPGAVDYQPFTGAARDPDRKKKTPVELQATTDDLEAALARNRKAAARVKTPDSAPQKKSPPAR